MSKPIMLSVVVACYNVADYLEECLDSLANQTYKLIEVIMIDDCSTDNGRTKNIVDKYDARYENFHAYHNLPNLGLSNTRNRGVKIAAGDYIAFVDGDDIVPSDAYRDLVNSVTATGSQVATGFVRRFDKFRDKPSYLHKKAISDTIQQTDLERNPELVYDSTSWNKLYSLSMVREHKMIFPANMLYEDIPFVMRAFVIASRESSIDILSDVVYRWRWRDGDSKSITQVKNAMKPYGDRLKILNMVRDYFLKANVSKHILDTFYVKVLMIDIPLFMDDIADADENFIFDFQRTTYLFLRDWGLLKSNLYEQLTVKMQLQYQALLAGNFGELKRYSYSGFKGSLTKRFIRHFWGKRAQTADSGADVKNTIQRVSQPDEQTIQIEGYVQPNSMKLHRIWLVSSNLGEHITASLVNIDTDKKMAIKISRVRAIGNIHLKNQDAPYSAYKALIDVQDALARLGNGTWKVQIALQYRGEKYESFAGQPISGNKKMTSIIDPKLEFNIVQRYNRHWDLTFIVRQNLNSGESSKEYKRETALKRVSGNGEGIILTFANPNNVLKPTLQINDETIGQLEKSVDHQFEFFISDEELSKYRGNMQHLVLINAQTNVPEKYAINYSRQSEIIHGNKYDVFISYKSTDGIWLMQEVPFVELQSAKWLKRSDNLAIEMAASIPENLDVNNFNESGSVELLSSNKKNRYLSIGEVTLQNGNFKISVPLVDANGLQVLSGSYRIYLVVAYEGMQKRMRVLDLKSISDQLDTYVGKRFNFILQHTNNGFLEFRTEQIASWMDRSKLRRGINYSILYPMMRMLPINRKLVVFESYWGDYFNGSPKAIYDYLRKSHPELKFVWILTNDQIPIEGKAKRAKRLGFKYWYYMARAKYLVENTNFPNQYSKRSGQIEVQTLHGTFMKTMGFDEPHFKNATGGVQRNFAVRNNRWDLLTVPSKYMADTATKAFDFQHEIVASGFPRNDALYQHDNPVYIEKVKRSLGIPLDKKVVLYAPTFRNNDDNSFDFELDLDKLRKKLSDEYVVLVRLHYFVGHSMSFVDHQGFVWDVSDYPDIADLYLISDVMITDYSSVMFDYGHLKRPMIFFSYDKDWYLNGDNRGVYLDYDQTVPGPIVETTDEIIKHLQDFSELENKYSAKIDQFYNKFCTYGRNGDASRIVSEKMLNLKPVTQDSIVHHLFINKVLRALRVADFQSKLLNTLSRILKKKNIIILESFFGTQFSDSPKAIYEYLKRSHPEYKLYWNVNRKNVDYFKEHEIPYVVRFGYKGILKQAQAKYWFTNTRRPFRWAKPQDTKLIQTWHGTPLKTIGTDVQTVTMPGVTQRSYHKQVIRDSARWDYLVAPNEYSYSIMQRAFRKPFTKMISSGYPRNDMLYNYTDSQVNKIKEVLEISQDEKVVLYAPTWRDNDFVRVDEYRAELRLDLDSLLEKLPENTTILIRTHYLIASQLDLTAYGKRVINVSDYGDVTDLYLISDVLITDYSSVMFDFANLKRPILFFAYDLDEYASDIRGFYIDYRKTMPGPIVKTNDELIPVLQDMLTQPDKYVNTVVYKTFLDKFASWEDGNSTQTLVEYVLQDKQYEVTEKNTNPQKIVIKDGSQLWSAIPETRQAKFVANYNYEPADSYSTTMNAQLRDPIHKNTVGDVWLKIGNKSNSEEKVWIRATDIESDSNSID
ncbi:bifunctional glycosyltransferase family 2 protein/CDP-glycerol:glycerophosphate glycerophosphotransferase [Pediococcus inopinatus]|uniref:bifunctional glycosyltransferase/CDP-glycerol:glycerophosphate glycerophosphotransferase n=1 Tax=Pediococcus inopinatus TaxID=114090 RepID=UPI002B25B7AC|nr:bifunctional glycosyltransferase family 2 protein/CDP-glycerol:glycerophosphate glycerophosphotransferase [Pediococcus inopinatus]WPC17056.1 bifunctional glycosyltransferase family 2 protein/CDP-glycerol:glycerophosphate glycerophosphotransferase [Pediococcus inopinatus]